MPVRHWFAYRDAGVVTGHGVEFPGVGGADHDVARVAALDPVAQVRRCQQRCRRDEHRAELHRCQDRLPQLDLVGKHEDQPVPALDAKVSQPVGDPVRPR